MFGKVQAVPQSEGTPFTRAAPTEWPNCLRTGPPLTIASRTAFLALQVFCSITNGRAWRCCDTKITDAIARIKLEKQSVLKLGNLDKRDWGYARVHRGHVAHAAADEPDTFVLGTVTR